MISIRESVAELERSERLRLTTLECYFTAIRSAAQYAIEFETEATASHRRDLESLADEVAGDHPDTLKESHGRLRAYLRAYREKALEFITGLRNELEHTADALERIMEGLAHSDGDHEASLRTSMHQLREISASPEIGRAGAAILRVADSVERTVEQMQKQHKLTVSQFQVEVRMLHQRIDTLERNAALDAMSKLLNRHEMESRIQVSHQEFSLLLFRAQGIQAAERKFGEKVAAELAAALGKRLRNCLPPGATVGNWSDEKYTAMVEFPKRYSIVAAQRIAANLSGAYSCLLGDKLVHPNLSVTVGVVEREAGEPSSRTLARAQDYFRE